MNRISFTDKSRLLMPSTGGSQDRVSKRTWLDEFFSRWICRLGIASTGRKSVGSFTTKVPGRGDQGGSQQVAPKTSCSKSCRGCLRAGGSHLASFDNVLVEIGGSNTLTFGLETPARQSMGSFDEVPLPASTCILSRAPLMRDMTSSKADIVTCRNGAEPLLRRC